MYDAIRDGIRDGIRDAISDAIREAIWDANLDATSDATLDAIRDAIRTLKITSHRPWTILFKCLARKLFFQKMLLLFHLGTDSFDIT